MPISVHALAHRPVTAAVVAELIALPTVAAPGTEDVMAAEIQRRGWSWEHKLVCDSVRTGYGHILCTDGYDPFGRPDARRFLVFGEIYPVDPDDDDMDNDPWLRDIMNDWQQLPGWSSSRECTDQECEAILTEAAQAVTEHLGSGPERTLLSSAAVVTGPPLTHRIWRTPTHAVILGPAADNGPYAYLTHLQLSLTPLTCGPDLPPADDEEGLTAWISTHVDW